MPPRRRSFASWSVAATATSSRRRHMPTARTGMTDGPLDLVDRFVAILDDLAIPYAVGGSVAAALVGEPRSTVDVDIAVDPSPAAAEALIERVAADFYVPKKAATAAVAAHSSFNIVDTVNGLKVDLFVLGDGLLDRRQIERRVFLSVPGVARQVAVTSPEDQVLRKLEWFRQGGGASDRQWRDILGILRVRGDALDFADLESTAVALGLGALLADTSRAPWRTRDLPGRRSPATTFSGRWTRYEDRGPARRRDIQGSDYPLTIAAARATRWSLVHGGPRRSRGARSTSSGTAASTAFASYRCTVQPRCSATPASSWRYMTASARASYGARRMVARSVGKSAGHVRSAIEPMRGIEGVERGRRAPHDRRPHLGDARGQARRRRARPRRSAPAPA